MSGTHIFENSEPQGAVIQNLQVPHVGADAGDLAADYESDEAGVFTDAHTLEQQVAHPHRH